MTGYRARVDDQVCVGTAMCQSVAPRAFSLNPEGQASYVPGSDTPLEELLEAAGAGHHGGQGPWKHRVTGAL
jgi:ferredoxin